MGACRFDLALGENKNAVGHSNAGKAMRNQDGGFSGTEFLETLKHFKFRSGVQRRGRLVKDQHRGFSHIGARDRDFLPFSAGQLDPFLNRLPIICW